MAIALAKLHMYLLKFTFLKSGVYCYVACAVPRSPAQ